MNSKMEYSYREFTRILADNGYTEARASGGHHIYKRDGDMIVVPNKPNPMVVRRMIKEHGLVV